MKIGSAFPSKWLKAADLKGKQIRVTIEDVRLEEVEQGKEHRPVMYFAGKEKGMVLNKTNADRLQHGLKSDDTDNWAGGEIVLYVERVNFKGEMVDGLRVRVEQEETEVGEEPPF